MFVPAAQLLDAVEAAVRIVSRHVAHAEGEDPQLLWLVRAGDGDSLWRQSQRQHGQDAAHWKECGQGRRRCSLTPWLPLKQMVGCEDRPWSGERR